MNSRTEGALLLGMLAFGLEPAPREAADAPSPLAVSPRLPAPHGPFAVGRAAYHLIDSSRMDPMASSPEARREIMVYVWYPAQPTGEATPAPYLSDFAAVARVVGDSQLRQLLGAGFDAVASGRLHTHALQNAPLAQATGRYPVLLFSHGFGESGLTYSAVLEDLASHGYIVFAVEHPYDSFCLVFPDGRAIPFPEARWDSAVALPGGAAAYQLGLIGARVADLHFVLDQLEAPRATWWSGAPFVRRLDLRRVGAFGHSLGGMSAVEACKADARIRACMNQDAEYQGVPWVNDSAAKTLRQPFLFFASDHSVYVSPHIAPPTDPQLDGTALTRIQYDSLMHRYQQNQDEALAHLTAPSYRVLVEGEGFNHRSFMDINALRHMDDRAAVTRDLGYLELVRVYTRAFFDKYLVGRNPGVLERLVSDSAGVTVERWGVGRPRHGPAAR